MKALLIRSTSSTMDGKGGSIYTFGMVNGVNKLSTQLSESQSPAAEFIEELTIFLGHLVDLESQSFQQVVEL
jgi:hypothetical protein